MLTQTRLDVVWSPHEGRGIRSDLLNPLSQWLVAHADQLASALPVLFGQLKRAFEQRSLDGLNALLDRVAKARPDLAPPEAYLRDDNPEGEWWRR